MAEGGIVVEADSSQWHNNKQDQKDEVLALESIYGDFGQLTVSCTPNEEDGGLYVLQVSALVEVAEQGIQIEAWVPYDDCPQPDDITAQIPPGVRPQLERTESGRRWHSSFRVFHLSPIRVHVTFPEMYPSHGAPQFSLSCMWLDASQLSVLCQQLDLLWNEAQGMPVVFTWVDWLQNNTLSHLALSTQVILTPYTEQDESAGFRDPRALPECTRVREDLVHVLRYDYQKEWEEFVRNNHECHICFDEKMGTEFFRISECLHHFCRECMTEYCSIHVGDGTVHQLTCPDQECKVSLPPAIIQDCLGQEAYERWERLLLQKALDSMGDIEYCPRCNMPVIKEAEEALSLANCMYCNFAFCTKCHEAWHSGSGCEGIEEQMKALEEESKSGKMAPSRYEKLLRARRKRDEYLSKVLIKKVSKPCASCNMAIEKNEGCNKIRCINCGKSMCWICGKAIDSYDHFQDRRCELFPGAQDVGFQGYNRPVADGAVRLREAMQEGGAEVFNRIKNCPRCRQRCLKEGRNNHIKCWSCKSNFCFMCSQRIEGNVSTHYRPPSQCIQHCN